MGAGGSLVAFKAVPVPCYTPGGRRGTKGDLLVFLRGATRDAERASKARSKHSTHAKSAGFAVAIPVSLFAFVWEIGDPNELQLVFFTAQLPMYLICRHWFGPSVPPACFPSTFWDSDPQGVPALFGIG